MSLDDVQYFSADFDYEARALRANQRHFLI
jgi:hypothetical protein